MSGHSHWAGIKHKKALNDAARSKNFSKLLKAVSIAARDEPNPDMNITLKGAISRARAGNVPADNIQKAIDKASSVAENLVSLTFEAYGAGGIAILIEAVTDNHKRTVSEVKSVINKRGGKWAKEGSVLWAFTKDEENNWTPNFPQEITEDDAKKLNNLVTALEDHEDVQLVVTNAA